MTLFEYVLIMFVLVGFITTHLIYMIFKDIKKWPIGLRSLVFGAHTFWIHPVFVFFAWWKLYGFPKDIRLWVVFFVHDIGYFSCKNMDGPEGEKHVELGAKIMRYFDIVWGLPCDECQDKGCSVCSEWYYFTLYHSRFYAKKDNAQYSKLCVADKYSLVLTPWWLYLPLVNLTGEIHEYMGQADDKYKGMNLNINSQYAWYKSVQTYLSAWVEEHKDIKKDTWTPGNTCVK